jgi:hypothetical protein
MQQQDADIVLLSWLAHVLELAWSGLVKLPSL